MSLRHEVEVNPLLGVDEARAGRPVMGGQAPLSALSASGDYAAYCRPVGMVCTDMRGEGIWLNMRCDHGSAWTWLGDREGWDLPGGRAAAEVALLRKLLDQLHERPDGA